MGDVIQLSTMLLFWMLSIAVVFGFQRLKGEE